MTTPEYDPTLGPRHDSVTDDDEEEALAIVTIPGRSVVELADAARGTT